jgi:hypothetical protein
MRILCLTSLAVALAGFALLFLPRVQAQAPLLQVRGVSLAHLHRGNVGYGSDDCRKQLAAIADLGANWVALTDFAFMQAVDRPQLSFGREFPDAALARTIADAHDRGLKVLLKPHIWSRDFGNNRKWAADIRMTSDADWEAWFDAFGKYILANARVAESSKAEALSVGCELLGTSAPQEKRWRKLIADVREVYKGYVIYSAAFGEYANVPWWDAVDCIGINAYMPLTDAANPTDAQLRDAWRRIYERELDPFQKKWRRPICFTELGYTASSTAAREPWAYTVDRPDPGFQARLYRIALEEAARHDYVRGAFVWKWFTSDNFPKGDRAEPFAIQDRPGVIAAIRKGFGK